MNHSRKLWHWNWKWKQTHSNKLHILPSLIYLHFHPNYFFQPNKLHAIYINTWQHCWYGLDWTGGSVTRFRCRPKKGDVTPVVSNDVERSRPHAHSRNLPCQGFCGSRSSTSPQLHKIRVNIRANRGFKPTRVFVGRSRGPSCPFCVRAITSASR